LRFLSAGGKKGLAAKRRETLEEKEKEAFLQLQTYSRGKGGGGILRFAERGSIPKGREKDSLIQMTLRTMFNRGGRKGEGGNLFLSWLRGQGGGGRGEEKEGTALRQ